MIEFLDTSPPITIDPAEYARLLGYPRNHPMSPRAQELAQWAAHWFQKGLEAYETLLPSTAFCWGDAPGMADCCLASHVAGAQRFKVDLAPYATVRRIHDACMALPAFSSAHPLKQPGAPAA